MAADVAEMQASAIPMAVDDINGGGGGGGGAAKGHIAFNEQRLRKCSSSTSRWRGLGRRVEHFQSCTCLNCTPGEWVRTHAAITCAFLTVTDETAAATRSARRAFYFLSHGKLFNFK